MSKKVRFLAMILTVLLLITGCSSSDAGKATDTSSTANTTDTSSTGNTTDSKDKESSTSTSTKPKVLRIGMATDVMSFDMANYVASNDLIPGSWVYDTLVKLDENQKPVPNLATSWEQIDDTSWKFTLRDDVYFTDGTQMNAEVVKFVLERAAVTKRAFAFSGFMDSVEVVDEFTVVIHTDAPFSPILNNLSSPINSIFSMESYNKNGGIEGDGNKWMVNNPVGSGPYKLVELVLNDHSYYELNENYWGEKPKIDRIEVSVIPEESTRYIALQQGEVDLIYAPPPNEIPNIEASDNLNMIISPRARNVFIGMNTQAKVLLDPLVRYAIQLAINNDEIVDAVLEGSQRKVNGNGLIPVEVCKSPFVIGESYNLQKAKEILAQSSYKGEVIPFWSPENRYMRDKQVAEVIQQQLKEVGINTELTIVEFGALTNQLGGSGLDGILLYGWGFATLEPSTALNQLLNSKSVFNYYKFIDEESDQMIAQAIQTTDSAKQIELYSEVSRRAVEDARAIHPLYFMNNHYASTKKLTGIWITPNELIDVTKADIITE